MLRAAHCSCATFFLLLQPLGVRSIIHYTRWLDRRTLLGSVGIAVAAPIRQLQRQIKSSICLPVCVWVCVCMRVCTPISNTALRTPRAEITLNPLVLIRSESCWCRLPDALSTCRIPLSLCSLRHNDAAIPQTASAATPAVLLPHSTTSQLPPSLPRSNIILQFALGK